MPRPGYSPPAPFMVPVGVDPEQQASAIAAAINRKADQTSVPTYASVHLIAPDGSVWMVSVNNAGTLTTAQMPR